MIVSDALRYEAAADLAPMAAQFVLGTEKLARGDRDDDAVQRRVPEQEQQLDGEGWPRGVELAGGGVECCDPCGSPL